MRIESEQLAAHLAQELRPLYTIFGEETLLGLEAADRVRQRARELGYSERSVNIVEPGFDWSQLTMEANSMSLFAGKRLIEIRIPSGKPGTEGADALRRYASKLAPDTVSMVVLPKLDKAQQASAWMEALDRAGLVIAANPVTAARLPHWLKTRLASQGQHADQESLQFLASRVEGNLLAAYQEVQKLALLFPPGPISFEQLEQAVADVARYDVFKLGECLLANNAARFIRMLDGLQAEGVAPPLILWALAEEARALLHVKSGLDAGQPLSQLLREARVWGARAELLPKRAKLLSVGALQDMLLHAADVDRIIKGLVKADLWDELLRLGMRLMQPSGAVDARNRGRIDARF
jgi:DNA polymerase-3 subunit delta